jgi:hypothetical protein
MRISELSPVVAAMMIVLLFSPQGASQVHVDVDEPHLQSIDTTHDKHSAQQQQQEEKIPKEYSKSSKGSGTTIESKDRGKESHATGSGPGKEESSIPLHINVTEKMTNHQKDSETVDVNNELYMEAASPDTDQQQNVQAEMSHTSDSEKNETERHAEGGDHGGGKKESVESESTIEQAQTNTTSPEEHGVDTSKTRDAKGNRQEASEEGATARVEHDARAKPIHNSTIKIESESAKSNGEEAIRKNMSNVDGEDGPHTESITEQHAVKQDANSNATSDDGDVAKEGSSNEFPTINKAEPSIQRSHDEGATTENSSEAQSEKIAGTEDIRDEPKVDKEPAATEPIQKATVVEAVKLEDVDSDIIDLDDNIVDSGNTKANGGEPADDADATPSSKDPTPTSDEKNTPGEKDPLLESKAAPKGSLADFFNKVNKNKADPAGNEKPQAAASNSFENMANLAQLSQPVQQESPPRPAKKAAPLEDPKKAAPLEDPKKAAPLEEMEYSGTWGLYLHNERPADLDLLALVFQDHLNRLAGGSYESKMNEARFPLGMGSDDEENEADVTVQREGVERIKKSVNSEFVEGLDDINKFFEGVDPPDELDVGAGGTSIQDVLMGQGSQILFRRIKLAFQRIRRAILSSKNKIGSIWTSLETRFRSEDGKFGVKKEDFADAAKGLWKLCVAAYRLIVKFIDDLLEGDDGSDDLDDFELDFKSKINLRDPALNLDLGQ